MARFIKKSNFDGTNNKEESYWQIWNGNELLLNISVRELCNMNSILSYELISTRKFGVELIDVAKRAI